ncbi:MAG: trimethylamine methyltransferase [Halieaceae bacterium]|nr:trimethylamine methyltransferase [Halieaceae bacterium]
MDKASESPLPKSKESRRSGGRAARRAKRQAGPIERPVRAGMAGGQYKPLSDADLQQIHRAAVEILATIGIGDVTPQAEEIALMHGCSMSAHGRLLIPASVIEDVIAGACREYVIHSRSAEHADLQVGGNRVHYATSGEAVSIYEVASKSYRPSTLKDLYDLARMVEVLPNIHQFGQMVVPTELEIAFEHDLNVAYAISAGTQKPAEMTFTDVKNIAPAISLFDRVLGGDGRFKEKPYLSFGGCPIVSPLRFGADNLDVLIETSRLGLINDIAIAPQAGATAPAHLAGALAQVTAEGLACLAMVNFVRPGCPMSFAIWPFVSDLRTGSFSGGSGEEALLMAAAAQIGRFYDLPTTVAASMTDSKLPDAQAGYEKGISSVMAGLAGANRVLESAGMLGSLMGCSFEALVIDNDMLGMAQRALRGIEVSDETLNLEAIKDVVLGPGHFLGHPSTLDVMESEYLYPDIADRTATGTWEKFGALDMLERASYRVNEILSEQPPIHIDKHADAMIRDQFPIKLKVGEFAS